MNMTTAISKHFRLSIFMQSIAKESPGLKIIFDNFNSVKVGPIFVTSQSSNTKKITIFFRRGHFFF